MGRIILSAIISFAVVVGIFLLMNSLISAVSDNEEQEIITVDLGFVEEEKKVQRKERRPPKKPPPPKEPPPPQQQQQQQKQKVVTALVNIEIDNIDSNYEGQGLFIGGMGSGKADFSGFGDGDAIPVFTVEPVYPQEANMKGIQGWVEFVFTISPTGIPQDIKIVGSNPRRVFDKEARRAIRKWKFKPRIYNGQPVAQPNMRYRIKFQLNN